MSTDVQNIDDALAEESTSVSLDEAIAELQKARHYKNASQALDAVQKALGSLDKDALNIVLENTGFVDMITDLAAKGQSNLKPGSPVYDKSGRQIAKVPYTMEYLEKTNPIVEWTPSKTKPISYNGVTIFVEAYKPIRSPAVFRDIFEQSERDTALAYGSIPKTLRDAGAADGTSVATGWFKMGDEELEKRYGREV